MKETTKDRGLGVLRALLLGSLALIIAGGALAKQSSYAELVNAEAVSPFRVVAEQVVPAVVSIEVSRNMEEMMRNHPFMDQFDHPWFDQFMPDENEPMPSSGSGFIIDADGHVVTNNHVVRNAEKIRVRLPGERDSYEAEILGTDDKTDLALIRILNDEGREFPFVKRGDSEDAHVGDWAVAIGNPMGQLEGTLTVGVISAKGRSNLAIQGGAPAYQDFIQTDAAINFGNSGGPLVDIRGRVIGINTAINASGQGIGFAIPINMAAKIIDQLREFGKVTRSFMGVSPDELDPFKAEGLGLDIDRGILVTSVTPGFPADQAGIRAGDVLTEFEGEQLEDLERFRFMVAEIPVGEKVDVKVYREGKTLTKSLKLVEFPDDLQATAPIPSGDWFGLEVEEAKGSALAGQMELDPEGGVIVTSVRQGSPADRAEIRVGDVILKIRDQKIEDFASFEKISDQYRDSDKRIGLLVQRRSYTTFVYITPDD